MEFKITSELGKKENVKNLHPIKTQILIFPEGAETKALTLIASKVQAWELKLAKAGAKSNLIGKQGPIKLVKIAKLKNTDANYGLTSDSVYAIAREKMGNIVNELLNEKAKEVHLEFLDSSDELIQGALVGLELALYRFNDSAKLGEISFKNNGKKIEPAVLTKAKLIGVAINQARHLVNIAPNDLNPVSLANELRLMFQTSTNIKVEVYDEKKLAKENCNLILGVGNSSNNPPRIVKLSYTHGDKKDPKYALIGKGVTFDTGGLDIKPSSGMRLMKKDMGGAATLIGFARWLEQSKLKMNIEIYLALAENAVSDKAQRPSDLVKSRAGHLVEIDNTDAEGRLVMADAMSLALDHKPTYMIDVSTLTGAGKVSLGLDIASLFTNDNQLADELLSASQKMGDLSWRMPLYNPYFKDCSSDFADFANSSKSGFAGSITAALFLEKFVGETKWAHFDIYAWTSGAKGSLIQKGGSGQTVETLIEFFRSK